jgi:hypothetical protein
MKKTAKARIRWLPPQAGGRKTPPTVPRYSTVVHFKGDTIEWPKMQWSLVVELDEPLTDSLEATATVWFLAHDHPETPNHFLEPGNLFELLEGGKVVATGEIIG